MKSLVIPTAAAVLLTAMTLASGCALDEIVTVDVPATTRAHFRDDLDTPVPPTLTLREARALRAEGDRRLRQRVQTLAADHAASNDALDTEIADAKD